MHPVGWILNIDERREIRNRGTEHMHVPIHVVDVPKIDEYEYSVVVVVQSLYDQTITKLQHKLSSFFPFFCNFYVSWNLH